MPNWSFNKQLVFIDADDPKQVHWFLQYRAQTSTPSIKTVLVNGEPEALAKKSGERVYFDQLGNLTRRFSLQHVPSVVMREGTLWKVQEFDVSAVQPIEEEAL